MHVKTISSNYNFSYRRCIGTYTWHTSAKYRNQRFVFQTFIHKMSNIPLSVFCWCWNNNDNQSCITTFNFSKRNMRWKFALQSFGRSRTFQAIFRQFDKLSQREVFQSATQTRSPILPPTQMLNHQQTSCNKMNDPFSMSWWEPTTTLSFRHLS